MTTFGKSGTAQSTISPHCSPYVKPSKTFKPLFKSLADTTFPCLCVTVDMIGQVAR